jgi:N6-adenosine-specific RNA methylase IME4
MGPTKSLGPPSSLKDEDGSKSKALPAEAKNALGVSRAQLAEIGRRFAPSLATLTKQARRAQKEIELAARIRALPDRCYGLIYADPPWRYEVYSRETGLDRDAANHYPVMGLDRIKALPIPSIAAKDCVLALWAVAAMLPHALETMKAWGFEYKSQFVWVKPNIGLGFWVRTRHEILLIGTRGHPPAPAPGMNLPSVFHAKVREHSHKPDEAYEILEAYFPTVPKVELFARGEIARPNWDHWGPESPVSAGSSKSAGLTAIQEQARAR